MLRIGHCVHGLGLGGAQQVVRVLAAGTDPERVRHFVYSPKGGVLQEGIVAAGGCVRILPRTRAKLDLGWAGELADAMRADAVDLVHGHLFGDSLHGYLAARRAGGLPVLLTLHATFETLPLAQRLGYRWLLPRVERVVACSPSVQRSFARRFIGRGTAIEVVLNGVPAAQTRADAAVSRHERRVIGAIGRLVAEKGYEHLIAAFARCVERSALDLELRIVGEGERHEALAGQIRAAGLAGRARLVGFRADVASELAGLDVVVFSSLREALPMALLEAMAAARPIVATQIESFSDALAENAALLVPPADPDALASAVLRILHDPELGRRLGAAAAQRFARTYSAERMVESYLALYDACTRRTWGREPACA